MQLAGSLSHQAVTPLHILLSLIKQDGGLVPNILTRLEVSPEKIAGEVKGALESLPRVTGVEGAYLSPEAKKALDAAESEAEQLRDEYLSTEHLLLGVLAQPSVKKLLKITREEVLKTLASIRGSQRVTDADPEGKYQALEKYTADLTRQASQNKIDPVVGREDEIRRMMQILSRRTKNNPCLVGEPGTGKTAIVEGLARK